MPAARCCLRVARRWGRRSDALTALDSRPAAAGLARLRPGGRGRGHGGAPPAGSAARAAAEGARRRAGGGGGGAALPCLFEHCLLPPAAAAAEHGGGGPLWRLAPRLERTPAAAGRAARAHAGDAAPARQPGRAAGLGGQARAAAGGWVVGAARGGGSSHRLGTLPGCTTRHPPVRAQELLAVKGGAPLPSPALLEDFCVAKVVRQLPASAQGVLADTVTAVEAAPAGRDGERAWGGSACVCGPCN